MEADEVIDRGAALAYYFLFALFPALLFLTALLGLLPLPGLMDRLLEYADRALPVDAASIVRRTLAEIVRGAHGGLLSIGVLAALWASSNGMASVMSTLNIVYDVEDTRPWWKRRLLAVGLTLGFSLFILAALTLLVFGPQVGGVVAGRLGFGPLFQTVWNLISVPVVVGLGFVGVGLVYYLAPAVEQRWRWVTPGSVVAGGVILLMLWLYLSGVVLLVGAEINAEIEQAAAVRGEPTAKPAGEREARADRAA